MDVPEWVWDEARPVLHQSDVMVILAVLRHGGGANREMHDGHLRARVTVSMQQLADMAGVSKRSLEDGFRDRGLGRFIQQSRVTRRGASRSFSVYYSGVAGAQRQCAEIAHGSGEVTSPAQPMANRGAGECANFAHQSTLSGVRCANFAHGSDSSRAQANGGGGEDLLIQIPTISAVGREDPTTTIPIAREKILRILEAFEFAGANGFIRTHGPRRIVAALAELWELIGIGAIDNPGGWLRSKVSDERRQFADPEGFEFFEQLLAWAEDVVLRRAEARLMQALDERWRELMAEGMDREAAWERASAEMEGAVTR